MSTEALNNHLGSSIRPGTPSGDNGASTDPPSELVECSCGHLGRPVGKGQCSGCGRWVSGNVAALVHGRRRFEDTGLLPDDLQLYREQRSLELVEALGGDDELSPQREMLVNHAANLEVAALMMLDYALRAGTATKRGRTALSDYRASVVVLRSVLRDLGLERSARPAPSLAEYLEQRESGERGEAGR